MWPFVISCKVTLTFNHLQPLFRHAFLVLLCNIFLNYFLTTLISVLIPGDVLLHIHTHPFISTSGLYPPLACVSYNCTVTRFVPFAITPITQRKWSNCIKDQKLIIVGSTGVSAIAASAGYFDKSRHRRASD